MKTPEEILKETIPRAMHLIDQLKDSGMVERYCDFDGHEVVLPEIRAKIAVYYPELFDDNKKGELDKVILKYIGVRKIEPINGTSKYQDERNKRIVREAKEASKKSRRLKMSDPGSIKRTGFSSKAHIE
jgi:siroheme synthase